MFTLGTFESFFKTKNNVNSQIFKPKKFKLFVKCPIIS